MAAPLTDQDYAELYGPLIETASRQLFDRILGQNNLHAPIGTVLAAFRHFVSQRQASSIEVVLSGWPFTMFVVHDWILGQGGGLALVEDIRVWGLTNGVNTVLTRVGFYMLSLFERATGLMPNADS